jgi:DNA modification methylase
MAKIEITRTELVWPGKYNDDGARREVPRVKLPFQVIETVHESRASREAAKAPQERSLFEVWEGREGSTFEDGWKNKLIWGDNLLVMGSLLDKFAGKIDLIYIDPPFATGADFSFTTEIGDGELSITKEQSILEEKAYRDTWGRGLDSYLQWFSSLAALLRELLAEDGTIYVHLDWHVGHYAKVILDEVFGLDHCLNEIIWKRTSARSDSHSYNHIHDVIYVYGTSEKYIFNVQYTPYDQSYTDNFYRYVEEGTGRRFRISDLMAAGTRKGSSGKPWRGVDPNTRGNHWKYTIEKLEELDREGRIYWPKKEGGVPGYKRYLDEMPGVPLQSIWTDINPISAQAAENTEYATQKPEALLDRITKASSNEGDLVLDCFCGSGTTLAVAEKLGRRWIGCDLGRFAIHTTRKRLLEIENCKPFEILNLGRYERQYWQGVSFASNGKTITEQALYEYLAFILKLYGAQPVAGLQHLYGKKGKAMVHIGSVDAPVTIDEINDAVAECARLKQTELHVLGWEWEMGLAGPNDHRTPMSEIARRQGVKLVMMQIPREVMEQQAADKGDVKFFELAYLEIAVKKPKKLTAVIELKDFVIPNTELIPEEVRAKVKKWSDYIDYWAVDWDFRHDTFMQGWVAYRTRKDRTLALASDAHTYEKAGRYRALVKVIDIFGNDTSQAVEIEVK